MTKTFFTNIKKLHCGETALTLQCSGPALAEFAQALDQALNCRPEAPKWLHDLSNQLNGIPEPHNARSDTSTDGSSGPTR